MQTKQSFLKNRRAHKQLGMSLPLMAIFIGVAAIFVVVAIIYGTRYFQQAKASNEITGLSDLKANIVAYGSRVGTFTAANAATSVLIGQGLFPASFISGTNVSNQWGGAVTTAVGSVNTAGDSLVITTAGMPEAACVIVATSMDDMALRVQVGTTVTKAPGARTNPAAVNTACAAGADNNTVAITMGR